jgi:nucleoid-associated protein YgaU
VRAAAVAVLAAVLGLAARAAGEPPQVVVVERGDTLSKIAARTLGDPALWPLLYRANRDRIKDPARVYPGQQLSVPAPGELPPPPRRAEADAEHP